MNAARHWWSRQRPFTRAQLDAENWPHPRPARDPRLMALYVCLVVPSIIQVVRGPAPTSVQGRNGFDELTVVAFAAMAVLGAAMIVYAAFAHSQYWSFVSEILGCFAIVLTYGIYLWGSRAVPDFLATNATWTAVGMVVGHIWRAAVIGRRFW